jgi:hypothetical protein
MRSFPSFRTKTATSVLRGQAAGWRERVIVCGDRFLMENPWEVDLGRMAGGTAAAVGGGAHAVASRHRSEGLDLVRLEAPAKIIGVWHNEPYPSGAPRNPTG